jgi:hypothetical protein
VSSERATLPNPWESLVPIKMSTSIGQNPFTGTIYFRKYSVYEGFLGENTRLRELRRRLDFGQFWEIWGNFGLFGAVFA